MPGELKPYPAYKDSGVAWLGAVPEHWRVIRLKQLLRCVDQRSVGGSEDLLTVSSELGVVPRRAATVTMFRAASYAGHKLCWPGDLVVNSLWAWGRGLGVSRYHGVVSPAYGVYRVRDRARCEPRFLHDLVRSSPFHWELRVRSRGVWTSRLQLTDDALLDAPVPMPAYVEQEAIARHLDHADRRIRRYLAAKGRLITLLEEEKQAVIDRLVTRGLDPNVPLKPSGVEWLGNVPEHWEVCPLRRRWTVTDCRHVTVPFVEEGTPLASVRQVQSFDVSLVDAKRTTAEWYGVLTEGDRRPRRGDLIYCRNVSVGAAAYVNTDGPLAMGQDVCLIRSSDQNQRYLNHFLRSGSMRRQMALLRIGSTFERINVADIKGLLVPVPPRAEQDAIAVRLDETLRSLERTGHIARREISLLQEYRTRLVADVVTGKLDVREAAASLPDAEEESEPASEADLLGDGEAEAQADQEEAGEGDEA